MPAGYSKRSLVDKLGIKPDTRILILYPPDGYDQTLGTLPAGVKQVGRPETGLDFIHAFFLSAGRLNREFQTLKKAMKPNATLWISWPKKAAKIETDITESVVRETGLQNGLVDIKVCAVDEVWSGLKFVYRVADRPRKV